jgi:hypothetical protein
MKLQQSWSRDRGDLVPVGLGRPPLAAGRSGRVLELAAGVSPGSEHLLALLVPAGLVFRRCCGGRFGCGEGGAASTLGLGGADPGVVQRQAGVGAVPHQMAGEGLSQMSAICFVIGLGCRNHEGGKSRSREHIDGLQSQGKAHGPKKRKTRFVFCWAV